MIKLFTELYSKKDKANNIQKADIAFVKVLIFDSKEMNSTYSSFHKTRRSHSNGYGDMEQIRRCCRKL